LDSKKLLGLSEERLNVFRIHHPIYSSADWNASRRLNTFTPPTFFINEGNDIEGEPVRIEHLSRLDFIYPERTILPKLVAHDPSPKDPGRRCLGVEEEEIATLQRFPLGLKSRHYSPNAIGNTTTPVFSIAGEHPVGWRA